MRHGLSFWLVLLACLTDLLERMWDLGVEKKPWDDPDDISSTNTWHADFFIILECCMLLYEGEDWSLLMENATCGVCTSARSVAWSEG